jgi:hypothetical protein
MINRADALASASPRWIAAWLLLVLCTQAPGQNATPIPPSAAAGVLSSYPSRGIVCRVRFCCARVARGRPGHLLPAHATDFSKNDQNMRDYEDCANQRPLTDQGRRDARAIGQRIAELQLPLGIARPARCAARWSTPS